MRVTYWIGFVSVTIKLAEQNGVIREQPTYQFGALVSDIGGALGLICGLSILDLLVFVTNFFRKILHGLGLVKRKVLEEQPDTKKRRISTLSEVVIDSSCRRLSEQPFCSYR